MAKRQTDHVVVRIDNDLSESLSSQAAILDLTRSQLVRRYISEGLLRDTR